MSVFVDKDSRVIIQGFTGQHATFHAEEAMSFGTKVVGGVTPGKGGTTHLGLPVFNSVAEAVDETGADVTGIFVPPALATDSLLEAVEAGVYVAVIIADGVPVQDMVKTKGYLAGRRRASSGRTPPASSRPASARWASCRRTSTRRAASGVVSRSGTLNYEAVSQMTKLGLGQSTCVGIGGDPVNGTDFKTVLHEFENDDETDVVVMIGEIGGQQEVEAARWSRQYMSQAAGGVHRRRLGAARPPHGTRRRGDQRRERHGDGEARRDRGDGPSHRPQPSRHRRHRVARAEGDLGRLTTRRRDASRS